MHTMSAKATTPATDKPTMSAIFSSETVNKGNGIDKTDNMNAFIFQCTL